MCYYVSFNQFRRVAELKQYIIFCHTMVGILAAIGAISAGIGIAKDVYNIASTAMGFFRGRRGGGGGILNHINNN